MMLAAVIACAAIVAGAVVILFTAWGIERGRNAEDEREAAAYYSGTDNEWIEAIQPPAPSENLIQRYERLFGPDDPAVFLGLPGAPSSGEAAAQ